MSDMRPAGIGTASTARRRSLGLLLMRWFLLLALLPMTLVAGIGYHQADTSLIQAAEERLAQAAYLKVAFLQNWFDYRFMDLKGQAENRQNATFLLQLVDGLQLSGQRPENYVKSVDWSQRVDVAQNDLIAMKRSYDYIYDLFLIDSRGNILFSIARESDLGTNLFSGPLADTRFARSVKLSLKTGQTRFSDLERYAPSNNRVACFLSAPLLDESGGKIGVLAIQVNFARIRRQIAAEDRDDSSQVYYLVGEDGLLRTSINGKQAEVLTRNIDTLQFRRWYREHGPEGYEEDDHTESAFRYLGPAGREVIGIYRTLRLPGVDWLLISEIDRDEALATADWLGAVTLILVALTGLLAMGLAIFQARRISRPIVRLVAASRAAADGKLDQRVVVAADNEIGELAEAFNRMLTIRQAHEKNLEESNREARQALADLAEQKFALDQHAIVFIVDLRGKFTFVNERFISLSGYVCDELLGRSSRIVMSAQHDKAFFREMDRTLSAGEVWHGETCNLAKNGDRYWFDSTIVPFKGYDGETQSYVIISTDITERELAGVQLKKSMAELERLNRQMTGREMRVIELKKEINDLLKEQGQAAKYGGD